MNLSLIYEETNMGKGECVWMQQKERFDKVEEEEYVKETFDLTLLRRVTLCIRRVLRGEGEVRGRRRNSHCNSPLSFALPLLH